MTVQWVYRGREEGERRLVRLDGSRAKRRTDLELDLLLLFVFALLLLKYAL